MLPSKLKRKVIEDKGASNGKVTNEKEALVDAESDYESDQVILLL